MNGKLILALCIGGAWLLLWAVAAVWYEHYTPPFCTDPRQNND